MSEIASGDGLIAVHPEDPDQFALVHQHPSLSSDFTELIRKGETSDLQLFTRSVFGQMGVNMVASGDPIITGNERQPRIYSPVQFSEHSLIGNMVLADLNEMRERRQPGSTLRPGSHGRTIEGGRYVDFSQLKRLGKDETLDAMKNLLLAVDVPDADEHRDLRVNDDGSITLPIALVETLVSDYTLGTREQRLNAIKHGRAGLIPHTDTIARSGDDLVPSFLLGGIALSPGPFTCVIREAVDAEGQVTQLSGAAMIDGNRLMGIGRHLDPYTGHRQVELANLGESKTFDTTAVTLDIFRSNVPGPDPHPVVDWHNMSVERRQKLHQTGISPLDVIHVANPTAREVLQRTYRGLGGIIMSAHGATIVPAGQTDRLTAIHAQKAATYFGLDRTTVPELKQLQPFIDALSPAGDRSRIFAGQRLLPKHMQTIGTTGDVQSFFIEDYGNPAMTQPDHSIMVDMVRSGKSIGWNREGEMRVFHRSGLWVLPNEVNRLENLDFIVAMYGTHREAIDIELYPQLERFFSQLSTVMPVERLAVTHGNGPGVMRMSDQIGRNNGLMSLGVGIEVEKQEQGDATWWPQAAVNFQDSDRLYRQQRMDIYRTATVLNIGGNGTIEEFGINMCSNKLGLSIPSPTIVVDPTGTLFAPMIEQYERVCNTKELEMFGKTVDISQTPLTQPWVTNTIHYVRHYDDYIDSSSGRPVAKPGAFSILRDFWNDPAAYWQQAGIPPQEVMRGAHNHNKDLELMGMRLAPKLTVAVAQYVQQAG